MNDLQSDRRAFLMGMAATTASTILPGLGKSSSNKPTKIPLGLDAHALRSMKWKAPRIIEYAAEQQLDAVLLNGLQYFEHLDEEYLKGVRKLADDAGIQIRIGAGGISEGAKSFNARFGSAGESLAEGIRVATLLGSPTVNCRIGSIEDRYSDGGIEARIEEAVAVLKSMKSQAEDAGLKFAFENHAGDTRTEEVLELIEAVGTDICGVMLDPGNALWAMEDPMQQLRTLGPHVLCTSIRDYMVWPSEEGATFQWTAIGDGLMDVPEYTRLFASNCPGVPFFIETISNSQRPIPYLEADFWKGFPDLRAADIAPFLKLCRRGRPLEIIPTPTGPAGRRFEQEHQQREFTKSVSRLREDA